MQKVFSDVDGGESRSSFIFIPLVDTVIISKPFYHLKHFQLFSSFSPNLV